MQVGSFHKATKLIPFQEISNSKVDDYNLYNSIERNMEYLIGYSFGEDMKKALDQGFIDVQMNKNIILLKMPETATKPNSNLYLFYHRKINMFQTKFFGSETQLKLLNSKILIISGYKQTQVSNEILKLWSIDSPEFSFSDKKVDSEATIEAIFDQDFEKMVTLKPIKIKNQLIKLNTETGLASGAQKLEKNRQFLRRKAVQIRGEPFTFYLKHGVDYVGSNLKQIYTKEDSKGETNEAVIPRITKTFLNLMKTHIHFKFNVISPISSNLGLYANKIAFMDLDPFELHFYVRRYSLGQKNYIESPGKGERFPAFTAFALEPLLTLNIHLTSEMLVDSFFGSDFNSIVFYHYNRIHFFNYRFDQLTRNFSKCLKILHDITVKKMNHFEVFKVGDNLLNLFYFREGNNTLNRVKIELNPEFSQKSESQQNSLNYAETLELSYKNLIPLKLIGTKIFNPVLLLKGTEMLSFPEKESRTGFLRNKNRDVLLIFCVEEVKDKVNKIQIFKHHVMNGNESSDGTFIDEKYELTRDNSSFDSLQKGLKDENMSIKYANGLLLIHKTDLFLKAFFLSKGTIFEWDLRIYNQIVKVNYVAIHKELDSLLIIHTEKGPQNTMRQLITVYNINELGIKDPRYRINLRETFADKKLSGIGSFVLDQHSIILASNDETIFKGKKYWKVDIDVIVQESRVLNSQIKLDFTVGPQEKPSKALKYAPSLSFEQQFELLNNPYIKINNPDKEKKPGLTVLNKVIKDGENCTNLDINKYLVVKGPFTGLELKPNFTDESFFIKYGKKRPKIGVKSVELIQRKKFYSDVHYLALNHKIGVNLSHLKAFDTSSEPTFVDNEDLRVLGTRFRSSNMKSGSIEYIYSKFQDGDLSSDHIKFRAHLSDITIAHNQPMKVPKINPKMQKLSAKVKLINNFTYKSEAKDENYFKIVLTDFQLSVQASMVSSNGKGDPGAFGVRIELLRFRYCYTSVSHGTKFRKSKQTDSLNYFDLMVNFYDGGNFLNDLASRNEQINFAMNQFRNPLQIHWVDHPSFDKYRKMPTILIGSVYVSVLINSKLVIKKFISDISDNGLKNQACLVQDLTFDNASRVYFLKHRDDETGIEQQMLTNRLSFFIQNTDYYGSGRVKLVILEAGRNTGEVRIIFVGYNSLFETI